MTSTPTAAPNTSTGPTSPHRLPSRKWRPVMDYMIPALSCASCGLLLTSLPNIITGSDSISYVKVGIVAASGAMVSFATNKLAIDRGAPQAAIGYIGAGVASVCSMMIVGGGLVAATYSGLVLPDVAELKLQEHGVALSSFVSGRSGAASVAGRAAPAIRVIVDDLNQKRECEINESCISGRGAGGRGTVTRTLESLATRAGTVLKEIEAGQSAQQSAIEQLRGFETQYQAVLGNDAVDIWQRRSELLPIDTQVRQTSSALEEAMPIDLLSSYADELTAGIEIADRAEATQRLNAILIQHGKSLHAVLGTIKKSDALPPEFPRRTGVADTLEYAGHFLPIALITIVIEGLFPLVLWGYTFWAIRWEMHKADVAIAPSVSHPPRSPEPAAALSAAPTAEPPRRGRKSRANGHASGWSA